MNQYICRFCKNDPCFVFMKSIQTPKSEVQYVTQVLPEGEDGGPSLAVLEAKLQKHAEAPLIVGSFSAGSNVTGIVPNQAAISHLLHSYGAISAWDYASAASCCRISCSKRDADDVGLDVVFLSPHKLPGGPGSCGVLVVRKSVVQVCLPQIPGELRVVASYERSIRADRHSLQYVLYQAC
jgi:selenocysteine lyase/cysteine desulfurase